MYKYDTMTEAMETLQQRGYTQQFGPKGDYLENTTKDVKVKSNEFGVDEFYRFEGPSDPGDEMTLYAISCKNGMKGVFVAAQGTYSEEASPELMAKFNVSNRNGVNTDGAVEPIDGLPTGGN